MAVKHIIFAQKNVKNNLNLGPNSTHVLREKAMQGLRLAIGLTARESGRLLDQEFAVLSGWPECGPLYP
jgi:hypothetical protein